VNRLHTLQVFTADGCAHCAALVADFRARGVRFLEINVSRNPEQLEHLRRVSWEHRLPVVVDHELVSIGFKGASSTYAELGLE
jgi:glutaredoxin